jgi:hypothetical protein
VLIAIKAVYDIHPARLGFVGSRRRSLLKRIHNTCVQNWKRCSTHDLFV